MLRKCLFSFLLSLLFLSQVCLAGRVTLPMNSLTQTFQGSTFPSFLIDVFFGTPAQKLNLVVDGGLDMTFLFTPNCTQQGCGLNYFYPDKSTTLEPTSTSFNYTYGAGNLHALGNVATDNGQVGGLPDRNQSLGLITHFSEPFYYPSDLMVSGVFGFAFPSAEWGYLSLLTTVTTQNNINQLMGLWLPMDIYSSGSLSLGEPDESKFTGPIHYVPLLPSLFANKNYPFFWSNVVSDILVNGVSNGYCTKHVCNFFIDLAARPMDLGAAIPKINVNPDCSNVNDLDTYTLVINGASYLLRPQDYILEVQGKAGTKCETGLYGGSRIPYPFTLGYTFIRNFYTILDFDNQRMGFAISNK